MYSRICHLLHSYIYILHTHFIIYYACIIYDRYRLAMTSIRNGRTDRVTSKKKNGIRRAFNSRARDDRRAPFVLQCSEHGRSDKIRKLLKVHARRGVLLSYRVLKNVESTTHQHLHLFLWNINTSTITVSFSPDDLKSLPLSVLHLICYIFFTYTNTPANFISLSIASDYFFSVFLFSSFFTNFTASPRTISI